VKLKAQRPRSETDRPEGSAEKNRPAKSGGTPQSKIYIKIFFTNVDIDNKRCKDAVIMRPRDVVIMLEKRNTISPSNVRQGRFVGMPEGAREEYLKDLKRKITEGYFFKESVIARIADELTPTYAETSGAE
jgi:hypothetical protein